MKGGVIVNASAGSFDTVSEKLQKLEDIFDDLFTGPGRFGDIFFKRAKVIYVSENDFVKAIEKLAVELSKRVDVLVTVGGDGTANLVASAILKNSIEIPIMGIAAGTANVGPLVRFSLESIEKPERIAGVNCLEVRTDGEFVGYAFIDVVFGDTFLGTVDGKMRNLSVEAFLKERKKIPKRPVDNVSERLVIDSDGRKHIHCGKIAQVIVSPLNFSRFYIGKAITGALCWAHFFDRLGALVVSDRVLVDSNMDEKSSSDPVRIEQIVFGNDLILSGFRDGVYAVIDGNPTRSAEGVFEFHVLKNCVEVFFGEECYPIGGFER